MKDMLDGEPIEEKARRVLGDPIDLDKALLAILDGSWSVEDARRLKKSRQKALAELERIASL